MAQPCKFQVGDRARAELSTMLAAFPWLAGGVGAQ
jgi:hypothetical protein